MTDKVEQLLQELVIQVTDLQQSNQQLRRDLLTTPATGWADPLRVGKALGFTGRDVTIVKKMHKLRMQGAFGKYGKHYRTVGADYQYHIQNCNQALNRGVA